jgi:FkbM family methyltransferase
MKKKLTVVMWDSNYRETLKDSLYCLSKINNKDELDFIFIEWGDKVNEEVIKYDFIKIIHINSKKPFDTGLKWNLGLYLSETEWVSYNHCDLMPPDHYEKIIKEINKEKNKNVIWFEGWNVNSREGKYEFYQKYQKIKKTFNDETHLITDGYKNKNNVRYDGSAANSFTVNKDKLISIVDGWPWNINTWYWCGPAYPNKKIPNKKNIRDYLKSLKMTNCKLPDVYVFNIPHKRTDKNSRDGGNTETMKNYSEFVKEWIPNNKYSISDDIDKKLFKELLNKENPIILDIGCYDGSDAIEFKNLFKDPKIYCFEADERSSKIFKKNIEINSISNIELIEKAVSNTDGEISWYSSDSEIRRHDKEYGIQDFWSASSSIKKPKDCLNIFSDITYSEKKIKSTKLDTWYNSIGLNEPIDLLWIDVNGGEKELIQGGYDTMNKSKYIYIEFCKTDKVELFEGAVSKKELLDKLQNFEEIGTFSYKGNYGNLLLKNKKYD